MLEGGIVNFREQNVLFFVIRFESITIFRFYLFIKSLFIKSFFFFYTFRLSKVSKLNSNNIQYTMLHVIISCIDEKEFCSFRRTN